MSSITKVPTGWRVRWRTPGGKSRSRTFAKERDAKRHLTATDASKDAGSYVERSAGLVTIEDWGGRWIKSRRGRDGAQLRPRTVGLYAQLFDTHIVPALGDVRLRDLTPAMVRAWHADLTGAAAPAKSYRLLRAMLATAVDDEVIVRNPCRVKGAGMERAPERPLPTGDEVWALADAISPRFRALVLTAAFVGLRWGELVGLRRSDLDLAERVVHVTRALVEVDGKLAVGPTKSAAGVRSVALPPALVPELAAHLVAHVAADPAALVFLGAKGAPLRRSNFNLVWSRAREQVGRPDLHVHDLRHYANTLAASAGASTRELMSRLGHASPAAALRYQHATATRDQAIAQRMDDLLTGKDTNAVTPMRVLRGVG